MSKRFRPHVEKNRLFRSVTISTKGLYPTQRRKSPKCSSSSVFGPSHNESNPKNRDISSVDVSSRKRSNPEGPLPIDLPSKSIREVGTFNSNFPFLSRRN